ncbi:hypothetical protein Q8A67_018450 [Cirrhinus molitorella]|uniref:Uncharacterized protein n=1 Tax=Cirrhinus molitorella TaxID=172907 RepID=A0AA88PGD3_9TELE|nr:hypothetical protein Q8A67_018450 [Cirrhinus molitorella]
MTNAAAHAGRHSGTSCLIDLRLRGLESVSPLLHLLTLLLQECIPPPHTVSARDSPPAGETASYPVTERVATASSDRRGSHLCYWED